MSAFELVYSLKLVKRRWLVIKVNVNGAYDKILVIFLYLVG